MTTTAFVLVADPQDRRWIESALGPVVDGVVGVADPSALLARLPAGGGDCLVASAEPDAAVALELVRELRRRGIGLPAIVLGTHAAFRTAMDIARLEATDFLERPVSARQLRAAVRKVCKMVP